MGLGVGVASGGRLCCRGGEAGTDQGVDENCRARARGLHRLAACRNACLGAVIKRSYNVKRARERLLVNRPAGP